MIDILKRESCKDSLYEVVGTVIMYYYGNSLHCQGGFHLCGVFVYRFNIMDYDFFNLIFICFNIGCTASA